MLPTIPNNPANSIRNNAEITVKHAGAVSQKNIRIKFGTTIDARPCLDTELPPSRPQLGHQFDL